MTRAFGKHLVFATVDRGVLSFILAHGSECTPAAHEHLLRMYAAGHVVLLSLARREDRGGEEGESYLVKS